MKKSIYILVFILFCFLGFSQTQIVDAYIQSFDNGDMETKYRVLQDVTDRHKEEAGSFFIHVLRYIVSNQSLLKEQPLAVELANKSLAALRDIRYEDSAELVWAIFSVAEDSNLKINALNALSTVAASNEMIINRLNSWLTNQNLRQVSGPRPAQQELIAAIYALRNLGAPASFDPIFTAWRLQYSRDISASAAEALLALDLQPIEGVFSVVRNAGLADKSAALDFVLAYDDFSLEDRDRVAAELLRQGLSVSYRDEESRKLLSEIRYKAVRYFIENPSAENTENLVRNLGFAIIEYNNNPADIHNVLVSIEVLGNLQNTQAAARLTQYLKLLNTYKENGQRVDDRVVLAVIQNIAKTGYQEAFAELLNASFLGYSNTVQRAAREALDRLK